MIHGNLDPLDQMFCIQSFDPSSNTFGGSHPGDKNTYLGAMWIGSPLVGLDEGQLISLQAMLSVTLPAGSMVQVGLLASPDIGDIISEYMYRKRDANNFVLEELINRHADVMRAGVEVPVVKASGVLLCKKRLIVTIKVPFDRSSSSNIAVFDELSSKLGSSLKSNGVQVSRATASDYLMICRLITHIYDVPDGRYDNTLSLNEQIFYAGDEVIVHKEHIEFNTSIGGKNDFVMSALSPKFFPKDFSLGLMNFAIGDPRGLNNQIRNPYLMVMTIHYPDQLEKKSGIDKKASWISHQLFGGSASKLLTSLQLKKEGFDVIQHEIESNSAVLVEATFALWLYGRSVLDVRSLTEDVRTHWASLGFEMRRDRVILDVLLGQCLPLNASHKSSEGLFRSHTLTTSQAVQFLPIISEWRGTLSPSVLLSTRRGELAGFDLFASPMNFNAVIVAAPGSGKSFVTQRIITDYLAEGAKIWVIDSGRSYQKLAAAVGGEFMEFKLGSDICLNPFTSFLEERGGGEKRIDDEMDLLAAMIERMAAQRNPLNDIELEIIKKAIRQTFIEHQGHSTIKNIAEWLSAQSEDPRASDLALRLDSFSHGQYSKYFNGHANVDMSADFVVLELDDLKNQRQLQQVVLLQLISQVTNEMYLTSGRPKLLIVDEAWEALNDPIMAKAMEAAYRKARKHGGGAITVTQGIADLYQSPSGQSMIENSYWQIILQQKTEAIDSVYKAGQLRIDEYSYQQLKTVTTVPGSHSELMIIGGGACGIFRLTVDRFTQVMYSTSGLERTQVLYDIEHGVDVIESIQRLIVGSESYGNLQRLQTMIQATIDTGTSRAEIHRMITAAVEAADAII